MTNGYITRCNQLVNKMDNSFGNLFRISTFGESHGKLTADIAKVCVSIPATRNISFGLDDQATDLTRYEHNDSFLITDGGEIGFAPNNAVGILGGISSGETIFGTVSIKPTATISQEQDMVTRQKKLSNLKLGEDTTPVYCPGLFLLLGRWLI